MSKATKKVTLKQIEAAKAKYELLGLRLEEAKKRARYSRAVSHAAIQIKKAKAFSEWDRLQSLYNAQQKVEKEL